MTAYAMYLLSMTWIRSLTKDQILPPLCQQSQMSRTYGMKIREITTCEVLHHSFLMPTVFFWNIWHFHSWHSRGLLFSFLHQIELSCPPGSWQLYIDLYWGNTHLLPPIATFHMFIDIYCSCCVHGILGQLSCGTVFLDTLLHSLLC